MEKVICLFRPEKDIDHEFFHVRVQEYINEIVRKIKPGKLSYTITLQDPPRFSVIPFLKSKIAVVSIYEDKVSDLSFIEGMEDFTGYYNVTEAMPVSYEKTWPDHEQTPGVCLLTLFRRKKNIDYSTFIDRWHNGHTPLSLKQHPLLHYNRNVVISKNARSTKWYDGIVEEHCRTRPELLNPFKFFGNPLMIIPNMIKVYMDVNSFIDYGSIETYLVQEYHIKSQ